MVLAVLMMLSVHTMSVVRMTLVVWMLEEELLNLPLRDPEVEDSLRIRRDRYSFPYLKIETEDPAPFVLLEPSVSVPLPRKLTLCVL